jgi:SAM-dependent methyltransferase
MLGQPDSELAKELIAQEAALDIYLDERQLLTQYDHRVTTPLAIEELLGPISGEILDAGCGTGAVGRLYPHLEPYGLDASFPLLLQCKRGYRLRMEASVHELPFEDRSLDAIVALSMLHHVVEPARAIAEFARVLRPGGVLVAVDPRKLAPIELAKRLMRRGDPAFAEDHKAFTTDEYARLLRGGGAFALEQVRHFGLLALIAAGGLDQMRLSTRLPWTGPLLMQLAALDRLLIRALGNRAAGLYLGVRARRT